MSKDNNSKTLNNLVSFFADEVEVLQKLTIPVVYAYPTTDGLYNGQLEYYQNALFVWDSVQSMWINIISISFSSYPPANPIQGRSMEICSFHLKPFNQSTEQIMRFFI